jgi:F1F0 ATPase subunit 2
MDGQRMTALGLALHFMGGAAIGGLYFGSLWWASRVFEHAGRVRTLLAGMAARFALLGGILTAVSLEGAMPLLATALGVLLARMVVLRRVRMVAP